MFVAHGLTPVQVASTLIAWSITGIVLQIPAGAAADRWSRRAVLAVGQAVRAAGFLVWVIWPTYPGFLIGMIGWGVKSALTSGIFEALLYDELAAMDRRESYAQLVGRTAAVSYVAVLAASIGAFYSVSLGYPVVILASAAASGAAALAAMSLPHARAALAVHKPLDLAQIRDAAAFALGRPAIPWIIGLAAVSIAFGGGLDGFWPIYASGTGLNVEHVAIFSGVISVGQIIANMTAHRLRRIPEAGFYILVLAMGALLILATGVYQPWTIAIVAFVPGLFKLIDVNFDARLQALIPSETRATLGAIKTFVGQVVMTGLLAAFGALAQAMSYRVAFLACGLALAGTALVFLAARRKNGGVGQA